MVNQKPISCRMHVQTLWELEQHRMATGCPINRAINKAAIAWLALQDARTEFWAHAGNAEVQRKIVRGFLVRFFPEAIVHR